MSESSSQRRRIPAGAVRRTTQPVIVGCGEEAGTSVDRAVSVLPLMDGDVVAGIEVRCNCGTSVLIECVYDTTGSPAPEGREPVTAPADPEEREE